MVLVEAAQQVKILGHQSSFELMDLWCLMFTYAHFYEPDFFKTDLYYASVLDEDLFWKQKGKNNQVYLCGRTLTFQIAKNLKNPTPSFQSNL